MNVQLKSVAILFTTLAIGVVLGGVVVGTMSRHRTEERREATGPQGFIRQMEQIIQPTDQAQRDIIRPILESTDQRNRMIVDGAQQQMHDAFDSMLVALTPHLTTEQLERLREEQRHLHHAHRPPPGLGPHPPPPPR